MSASEFVTLIGGIIAGINILITAYFAWKRLKPEVKKMDAEAESEAIETANLSLEGAQKSILLLRDNIKDMQNQLEQEKSRWQIEIEKERELRKAEVAAEREARKKEVARLRQRLIDYERENRDYRNWAAKLVKQVAELGGAPAPLFLTPPDESDPFASQQNIKKEDK